eukprot:gnl/TRDRNA2_/TRDRNA2_156200_c0_seq4.p1 gnl/TRDRNA2_/TRDRNA2_156200_c0~~gnl/TRDRNA2_/TRDRNA2_156200_c0_seq4.p1  ORF type:complete len:273 (-),score=24.91 gnl/TRDRNA2_/TRDRNA2_156200_c0_seq4:139-957(-)
MWTVKRFWSWTHEERIASGITSNGILEHDVMAMNYLSIASLGLALEHLLRVLCARFQVMESRRSAVSLLLSAMLCVAVQHLLDLSPDGALSESVDHNATLGIIALASMTLDSVARFAACAGALVFLLEDLPIVIALLGSSGIHSVAMTSHSEKKPTPAFDDLPSSYFHAIVSTALCIQLLLPRKPRSKILVGATCRRTLCKRSMLALTLSVAPVIPLAAYVAHDMQANVYYTTHGLISICYCSCLLVLAACVLWAQVTPKSQSYGLCSMYLI